MAGSGRAHRALQANLAAIKTHGDGFYVERERRGAQTWYLAMQLDAPGGFVVRGRCKEFAYARDAKAQIEAWKVEG